MTTDNVTPIKGTEKVSPVEGKLQNIQLNFKDGEVSIFPDIMAYQLGSHWVQVADKEGTVYVFKYEDIDFIRSYFTDKE